MVLVFRLRGRAWAIAVRAARRAAREVLLPNIHPPPHRARRGEVAAMSGLLIGHFEWGLLILWASFFGLGCLAGYHLCACRMADVARRAEEAERLLGERWDLPMDGWRLSAKLRKRAEKLRRGAAEALRRERARTLEAAIWNHDKSIANVVAWNRNATAAAARWRYRCRKVRAGAARRLRTLNARLREAEAALAAAVAGHAESELRRRAEPPRRIDQAGRDVTDLPGLWDKTDERVGG